MTKKPPFTADTPALIYASVARGIDHVHFPVACQGGTRDLVVKLLQSAPTQRLPCKAGGIENLKSHAWFGEFDWASMAALSSTPPYEPVLLSKTDLSNLQGMDPPSTG